MSARPFLPALCLLAAPALAQAPSPTPATPPSHHDRPAGRPLHAQAAARRRARAVRARRKRRLPGRARRRARRGLAVQGHGARASSSRSAGRDRQADQVPGQHAPPRRPRGRQRHLPADRGDHRARQRAQADAGRRRQDILRDYPGAARGGDARPGTRRGEAARRADRVGEEGQGRGDPRARRHLRLRAAHPRGTARPIQVWHTPPAHTDGDSVVYFEKANVLHMGDLFFHKVVPFIDVKGGGSPGGYLKALDAVIARVPADVTIIPGHGEVTDVDGPARASASTSST